MKKGLYSKLAWNAMKKNKRLYVPYIISTLMMVMIFYIIAATANSPHLNAIAAGGGMATTLTMGTFVMAVFSFIFLTYTNSILIKNRLKEFGLYNILGMDKRKISRVLLSETIKVFIISFANGMLLGIALSTVAETALVRSIHGTAKVELGVNTLGILETIIVFAAIFLFIFIKSIIMLRKARPVELMKAEAKGEKPPKANWVFAILGLAILAGAYALAIGVQDPTAAIVAFLIAVIMVIFATYLLFMSGSVTVCKALQSNKEYYYKKKNFISISQMAYRMKRSGASLASICILSTMVLVMISSTSSLYFGADDALKTRFPMENQVVASELSIDLLTDENIEDFKDTIQMNMKKSFEKEPKEVLNYGYATIACVTDCEKAEPEVRSGRETGNRRELYFISEEDYNKAQGTKITLNPDEAVVYTYRCKYKYDSLSLAGTEFKIKSQLSDTLPLWDAQTGIQPAIVLVIDSLDELKPIEENYKRGDGTSHLSVRYYYGYNLSKEVDTETTRKIFKSNLEAINDTVYAKHMAEGTGRAYFTYACKASEEGDFIGTYAGLFFLGILLSIIFIFACAMIVYYKQLSEGYEDKARFGIMQKIGLTRRDIKKSINSQVLTVFFAPLFAAGVHLAFSFPLTWRILQLFNMSDVAIPLKFTAGAFVIFTLFYAVIYKLTTRTYYKIVTA